MSLSGIILSLVKRASNNDLIKAQGIISDEITRRESNHIVNKEANRK